MTSHQTTHLTKNVNHRMVDSPCPGHYYHGNVSTRPLQVALTPAILRSTCTTTITTTTRTMAYNSHVDRWIACADSGYVFESRKFGHPPQHYSEGRHNRWPVHASLMQGHGRGAIGTWQGPYNPQLLAMHYGRNRVTDLHQLECEGERRTSMSPDEKDANGHPELCLGCIYEDHDSIHPRQPFLGPMLDGHWRGGVIPGTNDHADLRIQRTCNSMRTAGAPPSCRSNLYQQHRNVNNFNDVPVHVHALSSPHPGGSTSGASNGSLTAEPEQMKFGWGPIASHGGGQRVDSALIDNLSLSLSVSGAPNELEAVTSFPTAHHVYMHNQQGITDLPQIHHGLPAAVYSDDPNIPDYRYSQPGVISCQRPITSRSETYAYCRPRPVWDDILPTTSEHLPPMDAIYQELPSAIPAHELPAADVQVCARHEMEVTTPLHYVDDSTLNSKSLNTSCVAWPSSGGWNSVRRPGREIASVNACYEGDLNNVNTNDTAMVNNGREFGDIQGGYPAQRDVDLMFNGSDTPSSGRTTTPVSTLPANRLGYEGLGFVPPNEAGMREGRAKNVLRKFRVFMFRRGRGCPEGFRTGYQATR
ncbi:hypothetical protein BDZ91DRAFT_768400 [Kalaharituber pfeilii]|nr:hypothetical protein BDZ91DRAFT_768400 [Kalaharituber pfeilii]